MVRVPIGMKLVITNLHFVTTVLYVTYHLQEHSIVLLNKVVVFVKLRVNTNVKVLVRVRVK